MSVKIRYGLLLVILLIACPLFNFLDALPMQQWDEAHYANTALEMYVNHNWLVNMFDGHPDMWATKPPLMIWLQVICMNIIGVCDLAVRLPSAIAGAGTCLVIYFFFARRYNVPWLGIICAAILVTTKGYVGLHGTRSGDMDSVLTFFTTVYMLCFYLYCTSHEKKYWYLFCLAVILAAYTKGIQALLFMPALLVFVLWKKKALTLLKSKELYIGIFLCGGAIAGFYLLREHYNPGYIAAVSQHELGGRYILGLEGHNHNGFFYIDQIYYLQYSYWFWYIVPGLILGFCSRHDWLRDFSLFAAIAMLSYFFVISNGNTKVHWYNMPIYPFMAIFTGIFVYHVCLLLNGLEPLRTMLRYNVFPYMYLLIMIGAPYIEMVRMSFFTAECYRSNAEDEMAYFLREVVRKDRNIDGCTIFQTAQYDHVYWYYHLLEHYGRPVHLVDTAHIPPEGKLIVFVPEARKYVEDNYDFHVIERQKGVVIYQLYGRCEPPVTAYSLSQ